MLRKKKKLGFTLIELLVVIAILGVFASIILTATKNVRSNARDVRRIIELTQITKALEIYYIDKGVYPSPNNKINLDDNWFDMLSILADEGYISQSDLVKQKKPIWSKLILGVEAGVWQPDYSKTTPQDPLYPNRTYAYIPSVNHQKYRIRCQFEKDISYITINLLAIMLAIFL